jgi:hypothetical protein
VQVDSDIEMLPPQPPRKRQVVTHTRHTASPWDDNDVSQITITADDRGGSRFDHIGELALGIAPSEGANQRRREHHVANQP